MAIALHPTGGVAAVAARHPAQNFFTYQTNELLDIAKREWACPVHGCRASLDWTTFNPARLTGWCEAGHPADLHDALVAMKALARRRP